VADLLNHRIQEFDLDGNYVRQWGSFGTADGQFNYPLFIAVDAAGYLFVSDAGNSRVQKFKPDGSYYAQFGAAGAGDGQFSGPIGIDVDSNGNVYVADHDSNARVQIFSPSP
jgi:DNA-binding beta-propeller fold protein YncE